MRTLRRCNRVELLIDLLRHPPYRPGMDRRRFLLTSLAGALAAPIAADAPHAGTTRRLGLLNIISERSDLTWVFINELRDQGWVEGQNLIVEERFLNWDKSTVPDPALLARELLERRVDVLATFHFAAVRTLKQLTSYVPITFSYLNDPVGMGLVASYARPGGNVTGVALAGVDSMGKRLEMLKEIVPALRRVGVLTYPYTLQPALDELQRSAAQLGIQPHVVVVDGAVDFPRAVSGFKAQKVGAVLPLFDLHAIQEPIWMKVAAEHRWPTMYGNPHAAGRGGLIAYGEDYADHIRRHARLVVKVLSGRKPADLPIERPTLLKLAINLKTAKALGLTIPPSLLLRADQVIE
jgi:putative ABC transport system substrate-binding protein